MFVATDAREDAVLVVEMDADHLVATVAVEGFQENAVIGVFVGQFRSGTHQTQHQRNSTRDGQEHFIALSQEGVFVIFVLQQPVLVGGDFKETVAALIEVALAQAGEEFVLSQGTDRIEV